MNMSERMKEKALPASSVKRSNKVVKQISRADVVALNNSMKPIIEQNRREYIAGSEFIGKDNSVYGKLGGQSTQSKVKTLTKK